jgi:glycosyltransferase involved in cell wall biosynthesis
MLKHKLLYIAPHRPSRSPGQRFRFEQYLEFLQQNGFEVTYSYLVNSWDDRILYQKGKYLAKIWIGLKGYLVRLYDVLRMNRFDVVLIYREAHFIGTTFFEWCFSKSRAALVFDFDDAIWMNDVSEGNNNLSWLKKPAKTGQISSLANLVIVGNSYLAQYARQTNEQVMVIPTAIDTRIYTYRIKENSNPLIIGWIGSLTTIKHFQEAIPFLLEIKKKYNNYIAFKVIVDIDYRLPELGLVSTKWSKETEIEELEKIDIGIMPLPNDEWSKGKCGFKGIQYMSLGIPTIMSPVGVNVDIIRHGENGFLASTNQEWFHCLTQLIESPELRLKFGKAGCETIDKHFSVHSQEQVMLELLYRAMELKKNQ